MLDCLLIGDESLLVQCGEHLKERGHRIVAVISFNPAIRNWASSHGIPAAEWGSSLEETTADYHFDWLFSIANLRMLPDTVWQRARSGAVNFHDGPLPRYAGLNAPAWAILGGEQHFGVTWHEIVSGADKGRIYTQADFDISPDDTSLTLNAKCFEAGYGSFVDLIARIDGNTLNGIAQDYSKRSYFGKNKRPTLSGTLDLSRTSEELSRLFRALSFGEGYANPLVAPKLRTNRGLFKITKLDLAPPRTPNGPAGTVLQIGPDGVLVATGDQPILLDGIAIGSDAILAQSVTLNEQLPLYSVEEAAVLDAAVFDAVRHEDADIATIKTLEIPGLFGIKDDVEKGVAPEVVPLSLPSLTAPQDTIAAIALFIGRFSGQNNFGLAYLGPKSAAVADRFPGHFSESLPFANNIDWQRPLSALCDDTNAKLVQLRDRTAPLSDLNARVPGMTRPAYTIGIVETEAANTRPELLANCALTFNVSAQGEAALIFDPSRVSTDTAKQYAKRVELVAAALSNKEQVAADVAMMSADERDLVLNRWNASAADVDLEICVHQMIERQAEATPDAPAVALHDQSICYRELNGRANRVAMELQTLGAGPDKLVGLNIPRSIEMVCGALGILKSGAAYVPLDPDFPKDRLTYMVEDSGAAVILSSRALPEPLAAPGVQTVFIEDVLARVASAEQPQSSVQSDNLAYVIYTSGSTGRPKGVMVEHRNVVNFFAGMDNRIEIDPQEQPAWLAVTSLSFDISVLELFWTLTRGFKVVIHSSETATSQVSTTLDAQGSGKTASVDFGLFFWGYNEGAGRDLYKLLLEGAKFADENGFTSVWTPERHFHSFGGLYPNPSVSGAAVAAVTKNLSIRAGSCVLPLHHPARVAEEWSVIDNLSNGRVALAFASGWMPEDFVLRPENRPPNNKAAMYRDIETVRKLWRGDAVDFEAGDKTVSVVTQPRPVQNELPVWLTTAGNPETYRDAARNGANVLTHLLGQSIDELAGKIKIYRDTLIECGRNPDDYKVTLMLHTLLGEDRDEVMDRARGPMKEYLRSAAALIKQYAWAFPAFKKPEGTSNPMDIDLQTLSEDELDAILEFAFLRYFEDSGLFGTVSDALKRVEQISTIGVNEVACLIDFGVPQDIALDRLKPLAEVIRRVNAGEVQMPAEQTPPAGAGLAADLARHNVTHMQCTPSMARMFLTREEDRAAFSSIRHLYVGGEPFPGSLLKDIRTCTSASVTNMYGPTETTIWSSTAEVGAAEQTIPLGRPIANTQLYVLDARNQPAAPGQPGELFIGGEGVTRGYFQRPELTEERFLKNPFAPGRMYRTGDLVCRLEDGSLQFLGRTDHQVKVRGYRIELGEIEARIAAHPGVVDTVVTAREDRVDDVRLVAYVRTQFGSLDEDVLRSELQDTLPEYMVPAHFVVLEAFPLTPNAKIDRKALPAPDATVRETAQSTFVAPESDMQKSIADAYQRILGLGQVGQNDNFFNLGGHSLLAVQLHRDLKASVAPNLTITDIFRFPTVGGLAGHLMDGGRADDRLGEVASRAAKRRAALSARRQALSGNRG
ncbi:MULTISPECIES: MupA/Atu3671 family FMN-dependent luciferase-like monooxygenase [unclassified Roseibium]|uniref:MupA/Atu3671 family FMN-dependent luciferase-like monooxygenase n=1 Tax=unclassified Roseibium TaxID=2629323 RepID=UPI00273E2004|nr:MULTISPECIES: MupA/Atu3671 family FMN-dependent luciferase-like monooxygenase [unclassified Roseibium]